MVDGGRILCIIWPYLLGYNRMGIVHLEMTNILVALKLFKNMWTGKKVLIKCNNQAVVTVLRSGCTKEPSLGGVPETCGL